MRAIANIIIPKIKLANYKRIGLFLKPDILQEGCKTLAAIV